MPVRKTTKGADSQSAPISQKPAPQVSQTGTLETLANLAGVYTFSHAKIKEFTTEKDKAGKTIKELLQENPQVLAQVGEHREVVVNLGTIPILVRLQKSESVKIVDNVIDSLRDKLGLAAEKYIVRTESLVPGALVDLFNGGLLSKEEVEELTTTLVTHSLIVKEK